MKKPNEKWRNLRHLYRSCANDTFWIDRGLITQKGLYFYNGIPVVLVNSGAIYQRLVNIMFKDQIKILEVYVNDIIVKSTVASNHVPHLFKMFDILRKYIMEINPRIMFLGLNLVTFLILL